MMKMENEVSMEVSKQKETNWLGLISVVIKAEVPIFLGGLIMTCFSFEGNEVITSKIGSVIMFLAVVTMLMLIMTILRLAHKEKLKNDEGNLSK